MHFLLTTQVYYETFIDQYITRYKIPLIIIFLVSIVLSSCNWLMGSDYKYRDYLKESWELFEFGDYAASETRFSKALVENNIGVEAFWGRGWSRLLQNQAAAAKDDFDRMIGYTFKPDDYFAGLTLVYYLLEDYLATVDAATDALMNNDTYIFNHLETYNHRDIRFMRASANYSMGEIRFEYVVSDVNDLANRLKLPITINSSDASSWVIGSVQYESLAAILTDALEMIAKVVS